MNDEGTHKGFIEQRGEVTSDSFPFLDQMLTTSRSQTASKQKIRWLAFFSFWGIACLSRVDSSPPRSFILVYVQLWFVV